VLLSAIFSLNSKSIGAVHPTYSSYIFTLLSLPHTVAFPYNWTRGRSIEMLPRQRLQLEEEQTMADLNPGSGSEEITVPQIHRSEGLWMR